MNDAAGDFMIEPVKTFVAGLTSSDPLVVRAAAQAIAALAAAGQPISAGVLDDAVCALKVLEKNEQLVASWKHPRLFRDAVRRQINEIKLTRSEVARRRREKRVAESCPVCR